MKKRVAFHNLGCKVNSYELDIMRQILRDEGFEEVSFQDEADIYVVNTCTVTNIADRKSRQMLHRAKKQNPDAVVIAVGCYVETDPARVEADDAIDLVIGNNKKTQIGQILKDFLEKRSGRTESSGGEHAKPSYREDLTCAPAFEDMYLTSPGHTRAYIKIQDGCNQFCSYCIIPFARGRIRSRAQGEILCEVRGLVADGIREVVLTGIHVSSYGLDLPEDGEKSEAAPVQEKSSGDEGDGKNENKARIPRAVRFDPDRAGDALLGLLTKLNAIEGLRRIRLSSLEPRIMTERFIAALSRLEKVCPHFHLSLQSGCDATLRRMNRHYTAEEYMRSVELLRQYYDRPAITTDVIVGFPGETEEEFEATCAFLERIRFYEIHVFRYSKRNGTVAARMPDQVPERVKALRSDRLLAMTAAQAADFRAQFEGERETILLEEICEHDGRDYWTGSTARYVTGAVPVVDLQMSGRAGTAEPGKEPEKESGKEPEKEPEKESGKVPEKEPEKESGKEPGKEPEKEPGKESEKESGKESGKNPGKAPGKEPEKMAGTLLCGTFRGGTIALSRGDAMLFVPEEPQA